MGAEQVLQDEQSWGEGEGERSARMPDATSRSLQAASAAASREAKPAAVSAAGQEQGEALISWGSAAS